ncbi:MAG: type I restriction endonuclease subunit M [Polaromonas sp.]|nr:MAG: type I restriction endonuclease subunit M [Polaromonas sp.]
MPRDLFAQPLFSPKLIRTRFPAQSLPDAHRNAITHWAAQLKGGLGQVKEEAIRTSFLQLFFVDVLGYNLVGSAPSHVWTLDLETQAARGAVDACLGTFTHDQRQVVAPFELKGPKTSNLEALMPGRHKSPVQQAWEYANDLPGSQFVLVSNCDEIRLYALGYGRAVYESWTAAELLEPARYASFCGLLKAGNLLSHATQDLLKANAQQEREITQALYNDYKTLRQELILGLHHLNGGIAFADLVAHAQKLIDRLLFIAFAESRGLLPQGSIKTAATHIDPYNPQPRWVNFVALFRAVDVGNPYLKIPPYNGGLFAPDAALNALVVSDKLVSSFTKLAGYDYAQEVSVTVLGRIFEQSISDLERIASAGDVSQFALSATASASANATAAGKGSVDGKRKRDGVVYTPDHITRFIVEQTLHPVIIERFLALQNQFYAGDSWRKPNKDERTHAPKSVEPGNVTQYCFWQAWQTELTRIRVCDPACGSGAFLVAAFDVFKEAYTQLHLKLRELAPSELLIVDISHQILRSNLFGVDINAESIEITKLSLWLKTAELGRKLAGLEANFYHGNSLVDDASFDPLALDWHAKFAIDTVAIDSENTPLDASAGFDVVLGNPPYVRQELFTNLKPYLQAHYSTYHGVADLYVYFYELGLRLLKSGGRLGFISSSSFFKTSSGEPLRRLLLGACQLEVLVDFGDWQVFEGVTTYPAVVTAQKAAPDAARPAKFLQLTGAVADLSAYFEENKQSLDLAQLGGALEVAAEWQLEGSEASALRSKLTQGHPTLKQAVGSPLYGIKTGLNEAFVIDRATRDRLVYADIASEPLFKPYLEGKDIKRWQVESEDRWLIFTQRGTDISKYPHVKVYLEQFEKQLTPRPADWKPAHADDKWPGRKAGPYKWYEIQDTVAYSDVFNTPKIIYGHFAHSSLFSIDSEGLYCNDKGYVIASDSLSLLALLNSSAIWFLITGMCPDVRGGYFEQRSQYIENLPIPASTPDQQTQLSHLAQAAAQAASERLQTQRNFARRIHDLLPTPPPKGAQTTLGDKLGQWWLLADFKAFQLEVTKRFKADIPLKDRNGWEQWFASERIRIHQFSANIAATERAIDEVVYALFGLDAAEVSLIERTVQR